MYERVNPSHPDKLADRIAGAIVDLAYAQERDPEIAVEVLIGHGWCHIISESSVFIPGKQVEDIVHRIAGDIGTDYVQVPQDPHLAKNQEDKIRCGDNGIFKGTPVTFEQKRLTHIAKDLYRRFPSDGKYILDYWNPNGEKLIICQSQASNEELLKLYPNAIVNPLGEWTGGTDVDTGATNRKLGSDMGDSVTGGGLWGKSIRKSDVSINIYAWLKAQEKGEPVEYNCAIGDEYVDGIPYSEIVEIARRYIHGLGGFERFAEWGLIR